MTARRLGAVVSAVVALITGAPPSGPVPLASPAAESAVEAWRGRWTAAASAAGPSPTGGSVELLLSRVAGSTTVVGQFTFVVGAQTRTMRYEGQLTGGQVRFDLGADGRLVLDPPENAAGGPAATRSGEWVDDQAFLPAARGTLELSRVR
jgi:hypothetical protein